jgi:hypothetical protein
MELSLLLCFRCREIQPESVRTSFELSLQGRITYGTLSKLNYLISIRATTNHFVGLWSHHLSMDLIFSHPYFQGLLLTSRVLPASILISRIPHLRLICEIRICCDSFFHQESLSMIKVTQKLLSGPAPFSDDCTLLRGSCLKLPYCRSWRLCIQSCALSNS